MKEFVYNVEGQEVRARYYDDHLQIVVDGITTVFKKELTNTIERLLNVYNSPGENVSDVSVGDIVEVTENPPTSAEGSEIGTDASEQGEVKNA